MRTRGGLRRFALVMLAGGLLSAETGPALTVTGTVITNVASVTGHGPRLFGKCVDYEISYAVTATVLVEDPTQLVLDVHKTVTPSVQGSGGTLSYRVVVHNPSHATAYMITITDRLPDGVAYVGSSYMSWNGGSFGTWYESHGSTTNPMSGGEPAEGQTAPYYLRWVLTQLGTVRTAWIGFEVRIL